MTWYALQQALEEPTPIFFMTLYSDLQTLGLTANQAQVYLTLARAGQLKAGEMIRKTGLHRNLVYTALQELIEKKLVSSSKLENIAVYKTLAPARLLADPHEKERIARSAIEELALISKRGTSGQEIVVYEGVEEFRRYELNSYAARTSHDTVRYLGISPEWHAIIGSTLERELATLQNKKQFRILALASTITEEQKNYMRATRGLTDIKENPLISSDTSGVEILADRISIRSFVEPFFVVEIVQKELAKNYQNYFDFLWKQKSSK